MKRVRALTAEPPLLATYRASNPSEEQRPASEAKSVWDGFRSDRDAYGQVVEELAKAQQGLCLYCEQLVVDQGGTLVAGDYQIEHVMAKSGATGRVLDWTNLALACTGGTYPHHKDTSRFLHGQNNSCGQTKDNADLPPGTDPRRIPLVASLVEVGLDGKLAANAQNCAVAGVAVINMETALDVLKLNCERLRMARQNCHDNINNWVVQLLNELLRATDLDAAQRQQMLDLTIAGRLQPNQSGHLRAFWSTERAALEPASETWISNNQGLFQ